MWAMMKDVEEGVGVSAGQSSRWLVESSTTNSRAAANSSAFAVELLRRKTMNNINLWKTIFSYNKVNEYEYLNTPGDYWQIPQLEYLMLFNTQASNMLGYV